MNFLDKIIRLMIFGDNDMSKQTKKLTRRQKEILTKKNLNADLYRLKEVNGDRFTVININTNVEKSFHC